MRLAGKVAVVTGAGSGFGAEIARRFAAEGARVVCADLVPDRAAAVAGPLGEAALAVGCDVADDRSMHALAATLRARFERLDILVNNAGVTQAPRRMAKTEIAEIDRLFAVNVKSLYFAAAHLLPLMRERGGAVINIASVTAIRPRPGMTWYNASKAAVISITQSMAAEFAPDRIRVSAIAPGASRTPMFDAMFGGGERSAQAEERLVETFPLGRLSRPADIAAAAVYLASDDAEFVTGVILPVDGGRLVG